MGILPAVRYALTKYKQKEQARKSYSGIKKVKAKFRRFGIYDYKNKAWKTYYKNNEGKIIFERGNKNFETVKKEIKKKTGDIINRIL